MNSRARVRLSNFNFEFAETHHRQSSKDKRLNHCFKLVNFSGFFLPLKTISFKPQKKDGKKKKRPPALGRLNYAWSPVFLDLFLCPLEGHMYNSEINERNGVGVPEKMWQGILQFSHHISPYHHIQCHVTLKFY